MSSTIIAPPIAERSMPRVDGDWQRALDGDFGDLREAAAQWRYGRNPKSTPAQCLAMAAWYDAAADAQERDEDDDQ